MSTVPFPAGDRTPVLSRRAMLTVSAAAGLSGLCAGYVAVTRPLLRSAEGVERRPFDVTAELPGASAGSELAKRYLPDVPWAAKAEYEVRNGRSVLFFNTWEQVEQGTALRLEPFAMVFPPKPGTADEPVTIVGATAIVRVAGSIELEHADPGRVIGGTVPGEVRLRGPEGLDLQGRNFNFDENAQRLWSDDEVHFAHRGNRGRSRGIQLELFRVGPPEAYESVAVSGVRVVRLLRDVEVEMQLDDARGGPLGALGAGSETKAVATTDAPSPPTKVTCSGSFAFDLDANTASFVGDVVASRPVPNGQPDTLECDVLTIAFEPSTDEAKRLAAERRAKIAAGTLTEDDGFQAADDKLAPKWVVGHPAAENPKPTVLRSPSNEFVAEFAELRYEAATGVTTLSRNGGAVVCRQGASQLVSPIVTIAPSEADGPPAVNCVGKGWLQHFDPPGQPALTAHWTESLHRLRAPNGLDLIRLIGEARVEQPAEKFTLAGDKIDLWLKPGKEDASAGAAPLAATSRMEPLRLIAESTVQDADPAKSLRVKLRSPELLADAKRLDVTFVPPAAGKVPEKTAAVRESRSRLMPASGRILLASAEQPTGPPAAPLPEPRPVVQPRNAAPITPAATAPPAAVPDGDTKPAAPTGETQTAPPAAEAPPEPIELAADEIKVIAERPQQGDAASSPTADRGGQVREVHTTGGVIVRQRRSDGKEPLLIQGDRLDLFNRGKEKELVRIYGTPDPIGPDGKPTGDGTPARVHDQGATLFGLNINLDRLENRAWVEGKGVLELPAKGAAGALNLDGDDTEPAAASDEPQTLTVWWHDSMTFDGDRATFFGDVQTELESDLMTCQEMEVRLTERFDFAAAGRRDAPRPSARPEVAEVVCRQRVRVNGQEREGETVIAARRAEFDEFRLDQRTGDTTAVGPGWIEMWLRGDGNRAGLAADNAVQANSAVPRDDAPWEYIRVDFSRTSDGNTRRRTTTFRNDVRVVYGPVAEVHHTIDPNRPDKAPAEAGWMTCKELTLTQHGKTETAPAYSEVVGTGNVRLAGRGFSGLADWVSYDESKGQYVLKSFGNRSAMIAKNNADGRGAGDWAGQQITAYPAINKYSVDKAIGGGGVQ